LLPDGHWREEQPPQGGAALADQAYNPPSQSQVLLILLMSAIDDLLHDIFDGARPAFHAEFEGWVRGSRRYQAFAHANRAKIRAKLRNARHEGALDDLRAELATAAALLREERFAVEYETYTARKQRGPDFTVTYKTHTRFNVEVRRLRDDDGDNEARAARLAAVLSDKVGQMPPGIVNLLWLMPESELAIEEVTRAATDLQRLAERKDEVFFTRRGFDSAADFLKQYARLSGIALCRPAGCAVWSNPAARHRLPPEIGTAISKLTV
jgi:hypothetical protein